MTCSGVDHRRTHSQTRSCRKKQNRCSHSQTCWLSCVGLVGLVCVSFGKCLEYLRVECGWRVVKVKEQEKSPLLIDGWQPQLLGNCCLPDAWFVRSCVHCAWFLPPSAGSPWPAAPIDPLLLGPCKDASPGKARTKDSGSSHLNS